MGLLGWIFTIALIIFAAILIIYVVYKSIRNNYGKTVSVKAKVAGKSAQNSRNGGNKLVSDDSSSYTIVFESDDKTLEFSVPSLIYDSIKMGDEGILKYQGSRFINFG